MYSVPRLDEMCLNYVARRISRITPYVCVPCRRTQGTQTEQGHCLTVLLVVVSRSHTAMASHASRVCATDPEGWRHLCGCRHASTSTRTMCRGNYQNQTSNETTCDEGAAHSLTTRARMHFRLHHISSTRFGSARCGDSSQHTGDVRPCRQSTNRGSTCTRYKCVCVVAGACVAPLRLCEHAHKLEQPPRN